MIYLDHAATTYLEKEVADYMHYILMNHFGNPSSTHQMGQDAKAIVEQSRKSIAQHIGAKSSEIIFTSSGTESINWVLTNAVKNLEVKRIITTKIEHHATLYTLDNLKKNYDIEVEYLAVNHQGAINLTDLNDKLNNTTKTLVSLMHVNNEIGTQLPLAEVSRICVQNQALFHSDMVQSMGKMPIDLSQVHIDFVSASAHKFHGPKGVGFVFVSKKHNITPWLWGGAQEKGLRAGTEAVHQIAGMAKAIEIAYPKIEIKQQKINELRSYACNQILLNFNDSIILGNFIHSHIINVIFPFDAQKASILAFTLNLHAIAVSRGSACQSGSSKPSHVLENILDHEAIKLPNLRISFAENNTFSEIDALINVLKKIA
jgi:cysteine desulfurase